VRVDSNTQRIPTSLASILSPCAKGRGEETSDEQAHWTEPNILWFVAAENPSNCVFFACNGFALAVLTS
jgi:hypothetical protein